MKMKRHSILIISIFGLILSFACETGSNKTSLETGILKGQVTIGPLCPVEPCNLTPEQIATIYKARKVIIYEKSSLNKIVELQLNAEGKYSIELNTGSYIVDVSDANGNALPLDLSQRPQFGNALPQEAEIFSDQTTISDFDIDTGIR